MSIITLLLVLSAFINFATPINAVILGIDGIATSKDTSKTDIYLEDIKELFKITEESSVNYMKLHKLIQDALKFTVTILLGETAQYVPTVSTIAVLHEKIINAKLSEEELEQLQLMIVRLKDLYKSLVKRTPEGDSWRLYLAAKLKALDGLLKVLLALTVEHADDENLFNYGAKPETNTLPNYLEEEYKELFAHSGELLQCAVQASRAHLVERALKRFASLEYTSEEYDKKTALEQAALRARDSKQDENRIQIARLLFAAAARNAKQNGELFEKAFAQAGEQKNNTMLELIAEYYDVSTSQVLYRLSSPLFAPLKLRDNIDLLVNFIRLGVGLSNFPLHHRDKGLFDQELAAFCENKWSTETRQKWYNLFKILLLYGAGGTYRYTDYWKKMRKLVLEFDDDPRLVALTGTVDDLKSSLEKNKLTHIREADKPLPYPNALPCNTLLYLAVLRAKFEVVQYLLAQGLEVNETSAYAELYPLHAAIARSPFTEDDNSRTQEAIKLLLAHGAQPNLKPVTRNTSSLKSKALQKPTTSMSPLEYARYQRRYSGWIGSLVTLLET